MTDIVERLRKENSMPPYYGVPAIQAIAADEIERLRAALRDLLRLVDEDPEEDDPPPYLFDLVCDNARAALKEDGDE